MSSTKTTQRQQLRLRVFAGPNGSGKSTVIQRIKDYKSNDRLIDFGCYVNADDIAALLRNKGISFDTYNVRTSKKEFSEIARASGLITASSNETLFDESYTLRKNILRLKDAANDERLAQVIADFLRKKLLSEQKRFSFETVFSHRSKLEIMQKDTAAGYKVYLYFVSTESPEINKFRVAARKAKGGHDVPEDKIVSRYYRSLELLYEACQLSYQVFFFDNSVDDVEFKMFAHFKKHGKKKKWDKINKKDIPQWFKTYYSRKVLQ